MVIQRWQTVLLFVAAAVMAAFSFLTIGQVNTPDDTYLFSAIGFKYAGEPDAGQPVGYVAHTWFFFILSVMSAVLPLIAIFLYRNLKLQMRVCVVALLFMIACVACGGAAAYNTFEGAGVEVSFNQNVCAPFLAIIATVMAWQRINADKRLLESADRLR